MIKVTLNDSLNMMFPDGFHELDKDEREKTKILFDGEWKGITDPDRHMLVTAGWKKIGGLVSLLLPGSEITKNAEKLISKSMQPYGYSLQGFAGKKIAGVEAQGFAYTYNSEGTDMYGETYVTKVVMLLYYFHMYSSAIDKEKNVSAWNGILESIERT